MIILIHKSNKPKNQCSSYRPTALLPVTYKLFEKLTHQRLTKWSSKHNKIFPNSQQSAYQRAIGATTLSFNLQETIAANQEYGSATHVAMLDTTGAFDNVLHCALLNKFHNYGIRGKNAR